MQISNLFKKAQAQAPEQISPEAYNRKIGYMLQGMESSFGKDKRSADAGEKKWLTGLTNPALNELKRVKIGGNVDVNNPDQVVNASVNYFNYLRSRNPTKTISEIYADKYWNGYGKDQAARQRAIDKANMILSQYQE